MIGKIKFLNYKFLVLLISVVIFINSLIQKNFYIIFAYLISFITAIFFTNHGINFIKKFKLLQNIREEIPKTHLTKNKTPTMGGLFIVPLFLVITFFSDIQPITLKINFLITVLGFSLIGFIDDFLSIQNQRNLGLKSQDKLILQILIASFFIFFLSSNNLLNPNIYIFNNLIINIQEFIFPLSLLTIIGLSNSTNLTDGLDGLAGGCSAITLCGLGTEIILRGDKNLLIYSILSFCLSGICLGFLKFNKYPAKIFMGDTGSLSLGAIIGMICVITNSFFTTFIISGIFIFETLSVILQVTYFKITKKIFNKGKRLFLMTPIHHHFELKGINENKIVESFWIVNILLIIFSILLKKSF
tara:strand:- start:4338 stop:5411 length:1074 start_codon:yes stop_codon:yes gene_type:complete